MNMHPVYHQTAFPIQLSSELRTTWSTATFSRRSILVVDEVAKAWVLLACVVRANRDVEPACLPQRIGYPKVVLLADTVTAAECEAFLVNIAEGLCEVSGKSVAVPNSSPCQARQVAIQNSWMEEPGLVFSWPCCRQVNAPHDRLLAPDAPYFPDVYEAARDWLGLREYHGQNDGRKGELILLLPETRAYIGNWRWRDEENLQLEIAGSAVESSHVRVKGAYWCGREIQQLDARVSEGVANLEIALGADRLELFLMDASGDLFEHHTERVGSASERRILEGRTSVCANRIQDALAAGEGPRIEFKEFVDLPKHNEPLKEKSKFHQVLRTVAAFANTEGGLLFIGISDDCKVVGIREGLRRWAESSPDQAAAERYAGALRSKLADGMHVAPQLSIEVLSSEGEHLVLIEVTPSRCPISLRGDDRLLKRRGASNMSVPPAEWQPRDGSSEWLQTFDA